MKEIWKDIKGYEGSYQVSNLGRIRGIDRPINCKGKKTRLLKGKIIKPFIDKKGYLRVELRKQKIRYMPKIHRLVSNAFIPNPENKPQVNHKNGIKTDNQIDNLEWVDNIENIHHAYQTGLIKITEGPEHNVSKFTAEEVKTIRKNYIRGDSEYGSYGLAKKYGVNQTTILNIIHKKTYKNVD